MIEQLEILRDACTLRAQQGLARHDELRMQEKDEKAVEVYRKYYETNHAAAGKIDAAIFALQNYVL